jgi:hypothetical protein
VPLAGQAGRHRVLADPGEAAGTGGHQVAGPGLQLATDNPHRPPQSAKTASSAVPSATGLAAWASFAKVKSMSLRVIAERFLPGSSGG